MNPSKERNLDCLIVPILTIVIQYASSDLKDIDKYKQISKEWHNVSLFKSSYDYVTFMSLYLHIDHIKYLINNHILIKHINLSSLNGITHKKINIITTYCKNITTLNLNYCNTITDKCLYYISRCTQLTELYLKSCHSITN